MPYVPIGINTSERTVKPYIDIAETVLKRYIGAPLYNQLHTEYNKQGICEIEDIGNNWLHCPLKGAQKFMACYAYAQMIKGQAVLLTDMGAQSYSDSNGTNSPANLTDKQAVYWLYLDMAWQALEETIWGCLYPNACQYEKWTSSDESNIAWGSLVYSPNILRRYYTLPDIGAFNVWHTLLQTFKSVEGDVIEPLLCKDLYCALLDAVRGANTNGCEYGELLALCQELVATIAVERQLGRIIILGNHGLRVSVKQEPYATETAANDYQSEHHHRSTTSAEALALSRLKTHLIDNIGKYPSLKASDCFCKNFPDHADCKAANECGCEGERANKYGFVFAKNAMGV